MTRLKSILYHLLWESLDWLFPPSCVECHQIGSRWCKSCQSKVDIIKKPYCVKCGIPLDNESNSLCHQCSSYTPSFQALRSWATFHDGMRSALHSLKYENNQALGETFSHKLYEIISQENWQIDAVIPVPISQDRLSQRGYNQAALIAYPLALLLGKEYLKDGLIKQKDTRSQVGLSLRERRENVADAFYAKTKAVKGKIILVIDDVATTCSTLDSCAKTLVNSGSNQVFCLTVARALTT